MKKNLFMCAALLCATCTVESNAQLALLIETSTGDSAFVLDNGPLDSEPTVGVVVFDGQVDGFSLSVGTGVSKPVLGGSSVAELQFSGVALATTNAAIRFAVTDTGFLLSPSNGDGTLTVLAGGVNPGTSQIEGFMDAGNNAFGGPGACSPGLLAPLSGAYEQTVATTCAQNGELSLTLDSTHWLSTSEIMSFSGNVSYAPIGSPRGGEGCTPGYWKNHPEDWVGYAPNDSYESTFGVDVTPYVRRSDITLLRAARTGGGGAKALIRHSTAALLNATSPHVDYAFTELQVVQLVQAAFASGDFETAKNVFQVENELGCDIP